MASSGIQSSTVSSSTNQAQQNPTSSPVNKPSGPEDPISRLKASIPLMRESISSLFEQASIVVQLQSVGEPIQVDTTDGKLTLEQQNTKFSKNLEEFFHMCDVLESNIMVARATVIQSQESTRFTTKPGDGSESDQPPQTYSDYLSAVRTQVMATKELHDMLTDFSKSLQS